MPQDHTDLCIGDFVLFNPADPDYQTLVKKHGVGPFTILTFGMQRTIELTEHNKPMWIYIKVDNKLVKLPYASFVRA